MAYRMARRAAHNAHIELSSMISSLSTEPNPNQDLIHHAFRYLVYSHSQLSYVSALGSHRELIRDVQILELLHDCAQSLVQPQDLSNAVLTEKLAEIQSLSQQSDHLSDHLLLMLKQISLLLETLPELVKLRQTLLDLDIR